MFILYHFNVILPLVFLFASRVYVSYYFVDFSLVLNFKLDTYKISRDRPMAFGEISFFYQLNIV